MSDAEDRIAKSIEMMLDRYKFMQTCLDSMEIRISEIEEHLGMEETVIVQDSFLDDPDDFDN